MLQRAAALSYTTLLALVPLLASTLAILTAFPAFQELSETWQNTLFQHLVPTVRQEVQGYLQEFTEKAKRLTGPGIFFLVLTSMMLMRTVEEVLSAIWQTKPPPFSRRLWHYWAILTLGPLVVATLLLLSSRLFKQTPFPLPALSLLLEWFVFTMLFRFIPHVPVRWLDAALGGLWSALLFEMAKWGFSIYLRYAAYEFIYGALAAVPIFLVWLYLMWLVTLSGAVLSYTLDTFRRRGDPWLEHHFGLAYALLRTVWQHQQRGKAISTETLAERFDDVTPVVLARLLERFKRQGWLARDEAGRWLFKCDPYITTLWELYRSQPFILPPPESVHDETLGALLESAEGCLEEAFKKPLASCFGGYIGG